MSRCVRPRLRSSYIMPPFAVGRDPGRCRDADDHARSASARLGGMGTPKPAKDKKGELTARAIVFRKGDVSVAGLLDLLGFPSALGDRVRQGEPHSGGEYPDRLDSDAQRRIATPFPTARGTYRRSHVYGSGVRQSRRRSTRRSTASGPLGQDRHRRGPGQDRL